MSLPRLHLLRPIAGRRQPRFERSVQHDRLSTPSDLVLRGYQNSVKGLHR